jgi:D-threo-aldose 1-dehydrogenase
MPDAPSPLGRPQLGRSGIPVTSLGLGTSGLGGMPGLYGYDVDEERAIATILAVLDSPIRFIDTSNGYADAERRIGAALRRRGGLPPDVVLASKVDPAPGSDDLSAARVRASLEESLDRLGVDQLPLLYLHDPERILFDDAMASSGPVSELIRLRDEGAVDHLGVAGGDIAEMMAYIDTDVFDVVLTHSRFTLLDRSASRLLDLAQSKGIGVVNAAPYAGGLISRGPDRQPGYAYATGDEVAHRAAAAMLVISRRFGVPLTAAALQASLRDPRITSTVVGMSSPSRVAETLDLMAVEVPAEMWVRLEELALPPEHWL